MKRSRLLRGGSGALILGCALVATAGHAQSNADQARALLKAMSDYVGALQTIEASVDTSVEIVTPEMEKVAFTSTSHLKAVRPDKLHMERRGGYADVEFLFDGKTLSVRDRNSRAYAQLPLQADMDGLIEAVHAQLGLGAPGTDLLLRDSYSVLVADVMEAKYIGQGVVAGQMCDHIAFRNFDTDWQLWIRQGAEKAPCKMIITSKTVGMAPQYTTHVRSWKGNARIPAGAFQFRPAPGEQRLELSQLTGIDEVPPPASKEGPK